jgi:hypothetical protein
VVDDRYRRYALINLPHSRTVVQRIARTLDALGAFHQEENGGALALETAITDLMGLLQDFDEDPPFESAITAADLAAARARDLVAAILATSHRSDRLGQHVRNLFECLGLGEEGAEVSLQCGERPDSPLR